MKYEDELAYRLNFHGSPALTIEVELELQLLDRGDCKLTPAAPSLLQAMEQSPWRERICPEISRAMVEICSAAHADHGMLRAEMAELRTVLTAAAEDLDILVAGGGAHPFQHTRDSGMLDDTRFRRLAASHGHHARQLTLFGLHIHLGCPDGDTAIYLTHRLGRFVPHFIALAAASPFWRGEDTGFACARLSSVCAVPLTGHLPCVRDWREFCRYFDRMRDFGIVESMQDFFWDIRPRPELGTVEVRVCDTPLTLEKACDLAVLGQILADFLLTEEVASPTADDYATYPVNRYNACRHGLAGEFIDPSTGRRTTLRSDLLRTLERLSRHAHRWHALEALERIERAAELGRSDADDLRDQHAIHGALEPLARFQADRWLEN